MRSTITLFEDQYRFFKTFNSPNLMIAFIEYMFEEKEPEGLNDQEQVIFDSLKFRMDNLKKKSEAGSRSHGGGRPPKTAEEQQKNNTGTSKKTTEKQQKNNTKTTEKQQEQEQDQEQVKEQVIGFSFNKENMCNGTLHDSLSFSKFRSLYPIKKDKKKAKQKYEKMSLIKKQLAIDGISKLKESDQWKKGFIPLPTTYLNGERREDEVSESNSRTKQIQDFQRQTRLEEAKKLLNRDVIENENSDKNTAFDRRTEMNCS